MIRTARYIFFGAIAMVAIGAFSHAPVAEAATPAWYTQHNHGGYPSYTSCTQSSNFLYPGYNPDYHCYWQPTPIALSIEGVNNNAWTTQTYYCADIQTNSCGSRTVMTMAPSSPVYSTTGTPVQIDWSCLPSQTTSYWVWTSTSYDAFGNPQYNGYYTTRVLNFSNSATITRSTGGTVPTGGQMQGSFTETPAVNTTYTLTCGTYTATIQVELVSSFSAPLSLDLVATPSSVPSGSASTLTYSAQNVRSGGTCSLTGPGVSLTRNMGTSNFAQTGADQSWTAPAGITALTAKLWGAGGGRYNNSSSRDGGGGGFTIGTMPVNPGQIFTLIVGRRGITNGAATYGGGGARTYSTAMASGGGRSALRIGGSEIMTAGGGGGTGFTAGAGGGGTTGGIANVHNSSAVLNGGSQSAGGGPNSGPGYYGSQYTGAGGFSSSGAGGGWFGGGTGSLSGASGGSGRCGPGLTFCATINGGQGTPAGTSDPDYPGSNVGFGNNSGHGYIKILGTFEGTQATPALTTNSTYTLSCTVGGVTTQDQVTITVEGDVCADIAGVQTSAPPGCTGTQPQCIPPGYLWDGVQCVADDVCSDIAGSQSSPPPGCTGTPPSCIQGGATYNGTQCVAGAPALGQLVATPARVRQGDMTTLSWTGSSLPASCVLSSTAGTPQSVASNPTGGQISVGPIVQAVDYTINCAGIGSSVRVNVLPVINEL